MRCLNRLRRLERGVPSISSCRCPAPGWLDFMAEFEAAHRTGHWRTCRRCGRPLALPVEFTRDYSTDDFPSR